MNLAAALRHSVLRMLNSPKTSLKPDLTKEISESLTIEKRRNAFLLQWKRNSKIFEKEYPSFLFKFYDHNRDRSNDLAEKQDFSSENIEPILNIVKDLLGDPHWSPPLLHSPSIKINTWKSFGIWSLTVLAAFVASGMQSFTGFLIIFLLIGMEHFFLTGLWLGILPLTILPWIDSPFTALFGALGMLCLITLTSNLHWRWAHTAATFVVILSFLLWWGSVEHFLFPVMGVHWWAILLCLIPALFGWTSGTNIFLMPLVLPWFGIGFVLDGNILFGIFLGLSVILRFLANCFYLRTS